MLKTLKDMPLLAHSRLSLKKGGGGERGIFSFYPKCESLLVDVLYLICFYCST